MRWRSVALSISLVACLFVLPSFAKKKPPASPINLNTATLEQLQQLPGIGPSTADKILQMRKSYGAFKSVNDLLAVRGIGPKRLEKMRKYLVIGKAPVAKPAATPKQTANVPAATKKPPPVAKPVTKDEEPEEP